MVFIAEEKKCQKLEKSKVYETNCFIYYMEIKNNNNRKKTVKNFSKRNN